MWRSRRWPSEYRLIIYSSGTDFNWQNSALPYVNRTAKLLMWRVKSLRVWTWSLSALWFSCLVQVTIIWKCFLPNRWSMKFACSHSVPGRLRKIWWRKKIDPMMCFKARTREKRNSRSPWWKFFSERWWCGTALASRTHGALGGRCTRNFGSCFPENLMVFSSVKVKAKSGVHLRSAFHCTTET